MGTPTKGQADYYSPGDFNAVCSMCGHKRKASTMVKNWQGLYRCREHDEPRQPQDFVRGIPDNPGTPWAQPPSQTFVYFCSINTRCALPGFGIPGCMMPGNNIYDPYGI